MKNIKVEYYKNPKVCNHCNKIITYNKKRNIYCSKNCSASKTNKGRICKEITKTKIKAKIMNNKSTCKLYLITCNICNKQLLVNRFKKNNKTCSKQCKNIFIGEQVKGKTGGSTKQFISYMNNGNNVSLDSSWELLVALDLDRNSIRWERPSSYLLSNGRKYTPDFYLIDFNIFLDPKAYRKGYWKQIEKIKQFEIEYKVRCLVLNKEQLNWNAISQMFLAEAVGFEPTEHLIGARQLSKPLH